MGISWGNSLLAYAAHHMVALFNPLVRPLLCLTSLWGGSPLDSLSLRALFGLPLVSLGLTLSESDSHSLSISLSLDSLG